jgi:type I restriction enzyme S subunit
MTTWKEYKLGEIAELRREKFTPNEIISFPYIGLEHIEPKSLRLNGIGTSNDVSSQKAVFYPNDTLYGKLRPYFQKVYSPNFKGVCSTDIFVVKSKKGINSKFLFYLFASNIFTSIANSGSTGTRMPRADWKHLSSTIWNIPPLPTQTAIAEILSSLDDKIELNNKINAELENLAQTLFKQWFIDFEFPNDQGEPYKSSGGEMVESELGMIPKGWEVSELEKLCDKMSSGGTPSTQRNDFYNGNILWYSTKELQDKFLFASDRTITVKGLENSSAKIFPLNTVVMAIYAAPTVGRLGILSQDASFNQAALGFIAKPEIGYEYLFLLLKYLRDDLNNLANGAAQQNLNVRIVKNYKTILPVKVLLNSFQSTISPIFRAIKNNQIEAQELINLRDTLLPKLISGELEVSEVLAEKV